MGRHSYVLHRKDTIETIKKNSYLQNDLIKMTTYQLRDICLKERLIKHVLHPLDKGEMIRLILRYRGRTDTMLIEAFAEGGLERIEEFMQSARISLINEPDIHFPSKLTLYNGIDMDYFDQYMVQADKNLTEGNLLLVDDSLKVYSILHIRKKPDGACFITKSRHIPVQAAGSRQYSILYFRQKESELLHDLYYGHTVLYPPQAEAYRMPVVALTVKELLPTPMPLVIDFGSSNTTAGIFTEKQQYQLVHVLKTGNGIWEETEIIPSVLGILEIKEDGIRYAFGYQALQMVENNYLDEELPVFFDIKRWINDAGRLEKVISADGSYQWVTRQELLKAYLEYIILLAMQRFHCRFRNIQILTPVRQREKFKRVFESLLTDYKVECGLDEGIAVLFSSISNLLSQQKYQKNYWYHALIVDCGGGTTDLTSSKFKIDNNRVSYQIEMSCSYENGDTNFGGNNLTFRIFMLLKIRMTEAFLGSGPKNWPCLEFNQFRYVDEYGHQKIYEEFTADYERAEAVLPTRFAEYEKAGAKAYFKVKNNYYYLFEMAEWVKKKFLSGSDVYELRAVWDTDAAGSAEEGVRVKKECFLIDKWKLSFQSEGRFTYGVPSEPILFHLYEIRALLMPDVYNLIKKFFEQDFIEDKLQEYEIIKLTGQSCRTDLFLEALKEYIPGRLIMDDRTREDPASLKVCCLNGALFYFCNKKMGYMDIAHSYETGALPYELIAYTHEGKESILLYSLMKEAHTGHISRFMEGDQVQFYLRDTRQKGLRNYLYHYQPGKMKPSHFEQMEKLYPGKIKQEEVDNIVNGESKFFVWADKEEWGFYVLPVLRENDHLQMGDISFYEFEDDTWEENFFDGSK